MFGGGSSSRDYTYVSDVLKGIGLAIQHNKSFNTYNLRSGTLVKLKDLITFFSEIMDKTHEIIQSKEQTSDVMHTLTEVSKSKDMLSYDPKVDIQEDVERY